ncbi:MAG: aspartate--tRNA ligase [Clostridiales bacterium]|jgi:aspartyl-tRNA synthetase|nr:aspartate--tRNA ligase [Clostridiales bacterium]
MSETLSGMKRTHMCGELNETHNGAAVTVMGWVNKTRDLGPLVFITLRDREGIVQLAFDDKTTSPEVFAKAKSAKNEYVLAASGTVSLRADKDINPDMATGKIEIKVDELRILSEAETPPFPVGAAGVKEDMRMKHRYLDMRRPEMQRNFLIRHKTNQAVREFYSREGFLEIETPCLTKGTPEGAKEYIVPSRVFPGNFYVLPQSPQQFKQMLMVGGFDRYFQLARCFRDEDNRADRQPEFTQLDVEMSFVDTEDILANSEQMLQYVFKKVIGLDVKLPLRRMTYAEAMDKYGSDKPDLRFGMEINNVSGIVKDTEFEAFKAARAEGYSVRGINIPGGAVFSRKQQDALQEFVKGYKAKGLFFISRADGELKSSLSKFLSEDELNSVADVFAAKDGDLICLCADKDAVALTALGALRGEAARKLDIIDKDDFQFLWVTEMPLLEYDEENNKWNAVHHPFTAPMDEDVELFETAPGRMRAKAYDVVLNGYELGGGSVRIYQSDIQRLMFRALGLSEDDINSRFGHILEAFKYGAPPHGGIALGVDRVVMLMVGVDNIREVIAFPKTKDAYCPLMEAPNTISERQLKELGIEIKAKPAQ